MNISKVERIDSDSIQVTLEETTTLKIDGEFFNANTQAPFIFNSPGIGDREDLTLQVIATEEPETPKD